MCSIGTLSVILHDFSEKPISKVPGQTAFRANRPAGQTGNQSVTRHAAGLLRPQFPLLPMRRGILCAKSIFSPDKSHAAGIGVCRRRTEPNGKHRQNGDHPAYRDIGMPSRWQGVPLFPAESDYIRRSARWNHDTASEIPHTESLRIAIPYSNRQDRRKNQDCRHSSPQASQN